MAPRNSAPSAVLLDVGGVFFAPDHERILGAFTRAEVFPDPAVFDRAHYVGAAALGLRGAEEEWPGYWNYYLDAYITECGTPPDRHADVLEHLANEFAVGELWMRVLPGSLEGLRALAATGVRLGIVSNADGTVEQQLRDMHVCQVGPGEGVEVDVIIDSTVVGIAKPDPRIFHIALDAMGLEPEATWYLGDTPSFDVVGAEAAGMRAFLVDPFELHVGSDYERVGSLGELAAQIG